MTRTEIIVLMKLSDYGGVRDEHTVDPLPPYCIVQAASMIYSVRYGWYNRAFLDENL